MNERVREVKCEWKLLNNSMKKILLDIKSGFMWENYGYFALVNPNTKWRNINSKI